MDICKTNEIKATRLKVLIYGESGVGKTRLASTLTNKTLIISVESGLLSLKSFNIDYVKITGLQHLKTILMELSKTDYDNVYIDSLSAISDLFFEDSKQKYPEDRQTMKMYGAQLDSMSRFIRYCRELDKNIFFTALEKTTTDDLARRFHVPDLHGSIATKSAQYFDFVFNYRIIKKDDEEKRILITDKTETSICKDRSGLLDKYSNPNLQEIINKAFGGENGKGTNDSFSKKETEKGIKKES